MSLITRMGLGLWLLAACFAASAGDRVHILGMNGMAEILAAGEWREAPPGAEILAGQAVRLAGAGEVVISAADGRIIIRGADGTVIEYAGLVGENSPPWRGEGEAAERAETQPARLIPQFNCAEGGIDVEVTPGQPLRIVTPTVAAAVRGTKFSFAVDRDGSSRLDLSEGSVETVDRDGGRRLLRADAAHAPSEIFTR